MEPDKKNPLEARNKIISILSSRGPGLPVQVAKELQISSIFAGAFLSELASDNTVRISSLKVGGSPLYFLPGQEQQLENFSNYLPGKEKEAFLMLKEKKVLEDSRLEPAIRVALRSIKDFAFPITTIFQNNKIVFWRFHSFSEEEAGKIVRESIEQKDEQGKIEQLAMRMNKKEDKRIGNKILDDIQKEKLEIKTPEEKFEDSIKAEPVESKLKDEEIKLKPEKAPLEKAIEPIFEDKPKPRARRERAKPDKFLEEVKSFLKAKSIELIGVEKFSRKEVSGKIILPSKKDCFFLAIDKKRVAESDLIRAYKKASLLSLPFIVLVRGEISKKLRESIDIFKSLEKIEKLA